MNSRTKLLRLIAISVSVGLGSRVVASENVPHIPFAEWADVPERGQLVARLTYQQSESYYFWAGNTRYKADWEKNGEHYGIDITQGYITLQYALTERWVVDLSAGFTTTGWRFFSNFSTNGAFSRASLSRSVKTNFPTASFFTCSITARYCLVTFN